MTLDYSADMSTYIIWRDTEVKVGVWLRGLLQFFVEEEGILEADCAPRVLYGQIHRREI